MPTSQYKEQSMHCIFRRDLAQPEVLYVTHAGDQPLRLFAERIEFLSLVQILFFTKHGAGGSRTVESVFLRFPCDLNLLSELLSEVHLEFCNQHYRDEFRRTSSDEFPRTSRFVRFDGRRNFLTSRSEGSCRPCCKFGASTTRGDLEDWCTLQYKILSSFHVDHFLKNKSQVMF